MALEHRFHCTACGKCCHGWLPLTVAEAVAHAGDFPLAMIWAPVRKGAKSFALATRLGATVRLDRRQEVAVLLMPTVYIPPDMPCPRLSADGLLCTIHDTKPLRCRTMPFYPYQEEGEQRPYLTPRAGWACDTSDAAPVVYRDKKIVEPGDFTRERAALVQQAPVLRAYAEMMVKTSPSLVALLAKASLNPMGGKVPVSFSSFLSLSRTIDTRAFAEQQIPVLTDHAARTEGRPDWAEYHAHYKRFAAEMERFRR